MLKVPLYFSHPYFSSLLLFCFVSFALCLLISWKHELHISTYWRPCIGIEIAPIPTFFHRFHFHLRPFLQKFGSLFRPSSSTFSGRQPLRISVMGFSSGLDVLAVSQPSVSKHWREPVAWPHPFFIHHQTPDGRGVAAFMLAFQHYYQTTPVECSIDRMWIQVCCTKRMPTLQQIGYWR